MKILCVIPYYKPAFVYGGPTRSIASLCSGMAQAGAEVTVFTTDANGPGRSLDVPLQQPVNVDGAIVYYFPRNLSREVLPFFSRTLAEACAASVHRFDVLYVCSTWCYPMIPAARAAVRSRVPYVVSPRGALMSWPMQQKWLKKRLYLELIERHWLQAAAAIHCTSVLEREQMAQWQLRPFTMVIPNGLDVSGFERLPPRGAFRERMGIPHNACLSLLVGRLHKQKRLDLAIRAFATVIRQKPDAHVALVGPDGGAERTLRTLIQSLGIAKNVHFVPLVTGCELLQVYADSDLLVLLASSESFAMCVAEAMAAGVPVLVTKDVGLAADVQEACAGCVVSPDIEEVAWTWLKMLNDPRLQESGLRGRTLARHRFDHRVVASQMLEFLSSVSSLRGQDHAVLRTANVTL